MVSGFAAGGRPPRRATPRARCTRRCGRSAGTGGVLRRAGRRPQLTANVAVTVWLTSAGTRQPKRERTRPVETRRPGASRRRIGVRIRLPNRPGPNVPSEPRSIRSGLPQRPEPRRRTGGACSAAVDLQPEQRDERLGVARGGDRAVEVVERPADDLDALVLVGVRRAVRQAGRVEDVDDLVGHPRARDVAQHGLPALRRLADLLGQLALGGLQRRLALLVQAPGRDLEEVRVADRLARLAHEVQVRVVVGEDRGGAAVAHGLALHLVAVGVAVALDAQRDDLALVDGVAADVLEAAVLGAHGAPAYPESSSSNANVTSSMPWSAAWGIRSVGSWLRSVPLARFVQSMPPATSAFASDAPPVVMRVGA